MSARIFVRVEGAILWCIPRTATIGHSIVAYCDARSNQSDPVHVASNPPVIERCTACELAADTPVPDAREDFDDDVITGMAELASDYSADLNALYADFGGEG